MTDAIHGQYLVSLEQSLTILFCVELADSRTACCTTREFDVHLLVQLVDLL